MKRILSHALFLLFATSVCLAQLPANRGHRVSKDGAFSIILIPDLQSYSKFERNQAIPELITTWITSQKKSLNIKAVLSVGDLVEQNEYLVPDVARGDQTGIEQWEAISHAFARLDKAGIPYSVSLGNHDYGYVKAENRRTYFNDYFPIERNQAMRDMWVSVCNNAFGMPTLENAAFELKTEHWGDLLIVNSEFAPRDEVIDWAKALVNEKRFESHRVILTTHSFLDGKGERIQTEGYKLEGSSSKNYAEAMWEKLIYPSKNIRLILCGHYCNTEKDFSKNVSRRRDKNQSGAFVEQMMFNAQTADGEWNGNGGDGWIRILEFMPDGKTIHVKTFSPLFGFSKETSDKAWRTAPYDDFKLIIE